jgi:outer membrane protein
MKKIVLLLASLGLISCLSAAGATDLLDVFHQAKKSDQTYQQAESNYLSAQTTLDQSRAKLLPNLALTGSWTHNKVDTNTSANYGTTGQSDLVANSAVTAYGLTLSQPLFNWQAFKAYDQIKVTVKQAAATYAASAQDLIMRTASAYFAVLQAQDVLRYTAVQQTALLRQLQVAKQRYEVGLDAITSVYDAQAQYDAMRANYIAAANSLSVQKENLRVITDQLYPSLARLKDDFPLLSPNPTDIDQWALTAENQNVTLQAQRYAVEAAEQNIKQLSAQHLPTLNLVGSYGKADTVLDGSGADQAITTTSYGVNLNVPLYAGGSVNAQVKQAEYLYQAAVAQMSLTHRQTLSNVRQAYLGVLSNISQIEADRQAIKSAQAALSSNEAGYRVGTQTILNVLTAQSTVYQAETNYAKDRFSYVINTLTLKQAAGTLNENDVVAINQWLTNEPLVEVEQKNTTPVQPMYKKKAKKVVVKKPVQKTVTQPVHKSVTTQPAPQHTQSA